MRTIQTIIDGAASALVRRDPDTGEFVVSFYAADKHRRGADYFSDDKADAIGTARAQVATMATKAKAPAPTLPAPSRALLLRTLRNARAALDSAAFISQPGDTARPLADIDRCLAAFEGAPVATAPALAT